MKMRRQNTGYGIQKTENRIQNSGVTESGIAASEFEFPKGPLEFASITRLAADS